MIDLVYKRSSLPQFFHQPNSMPPLIIFPLPYSEFNLLLGRCMLEVRYKCFDFEALLQEPIGLFGFNVPFHMSNNPIFELLICQLTSHVLSFHRLQWFELKLLQIGLVLHEIQFRARWVLYVIVILRDLNHLIIPLSPEWLRFLHYLLDFQSVLFEFRR